MIAAPFHVRHQLGVSFQDSCLFQGTCLPAECKHVYFVVVGAKGQGSAVLAPSMAGYDVRQSVCCHPNYVSTTIMRNDLANTRCHNGMWCAITTMIYPATILFTTHKMHVLKLIYEDHHEAMLSITVHVKPL